MTVNVTNWNWIHSIPSMQSVVWSGVGKHWYLAVIPGVVRLGSWWDKGTLMAAHDHNIHTVGQKNVPAFICL